MVEINLKSLSPTSEGGIGKLIMWGAGLTIISFIAVTGFNFLTNVTSEFTKGTVLESSIDARAGQTTLDASAVGQLGVGSHPYSTVTFEQYVYDGSGGTFASISQYIWDEEPENWANPLNISSDYTTPKDITGKNAISTPKTVTITDTKMTATLSTALGESDSVVDGAGNLVVVDKTYYVHGGITGAPDLFFKLNVPSAGAVDSTTPTIRFADITNPVFDTTAWTSSAIDLGVGSNDSANQALTQTVSYRILDSNVVQVKQISIQDLNKMGDDGTLDEVTIIIGDIEWTPYKYSSSIDETAYDGSSGFDAYLKGSIESETGILTTIEAGVNVDLEVRVTADTTSGAGAGDLGDGDTLFTLQITDIEGNTLVNQVVRG